MKRFLCIFLCFLLTLTALPLTALAETINADNTSFNSDGLAVDVLSPEEMGEKSLAELYAGTETGTGNPEEPAPEEPAPEAPAPTEAPVPTETPVPTEAPVPTEEPVPTETPIPTEEPIPTEAPVPTETPAPTEGTVSGSWVYRVDAEGHALIVGYLDKTAASLQVPDALDGFFVTGLAPNALFDLAALTQIEIHGNVTQLGENALPAGVAVSAYHGAAALAYAAENGLAFTDLSAFYFVDGVIDYSDIQKGRYAFAGDTDIRMKPLEAGRLRVGSVFYLPASEKYPNGEAFCVESISASGSWTALSCRVAMGEEVVTRVVVENETLTPDWDNAILYDGVTLAPADAPLGGDMSAQSIDTSFSFTSKIVLDKTISGALSLIGSLALTVGADVAVDASLIPAKLDTLKLVGNAKLEGNVGLQCKSTVFQSLEIPLLSVPLVGSGLANVVYDLYLKVDVKGTATVKVTCSSKFGTEWNKARKEFQKVSERDFTLKPLSINGEIKVYFDMALALKVALLGSVASVRAEIGVKFTFTYIGSLCIDAKCSLYTAVVLRFDLAEESKLIRQLVDKVTWRLREETIPFEKLNFHLELENGVLQVMPECSHGGEAEGKYTVSFYTGTGQSVPAQTISANACATVPTVTAPKNNNLLGWYTDAGYTTPWDFATPVTRDMILYAKWETAEGVVPGGGGGGGGGVPSGPTTPVDKLEYYIENGGVTITGCDADVTTLNIPASIEGLPVRHIGYGAFNKNTKLVFANIPDSVTSIGDWAFMGCTSLTSVDIPDSVINIEYEAFRGCSSLTSVDIPDSVINIEYAAFHGCSSLTSVNIPNSVTSIGRSAFDGCSSLTSVSLGNGVTSIGQNAFYDCSSLTSIDIPDSVTSIGNYAFWGCSSLTSVTIPDSVTSMGGGTFCGCSSLTSVSLGNGVTNIYHNAFFGCSSLTSIDIPDSVTSIGSYAFSDCSSLTSVTIPDSVTSSIGERAFQDCSSLTSINIPGSVTSIGEYAFYQCSSLTSASLGNSVTSIGQNAFYDCSSLTAISIPPSVTSIGKQTFYGCSRLTSIIIPDGVTNIADRTFQHCHSLTSVTIPSSVTSIGNYAFWNCSRLTSVTIPASVTSIGTEVFKFSNRLTICAPSGSCAETYAVQNGIPFRAIGNDQYALTYFSNGGGYYAPLYLRAGAAVPRPADPVRSGYSFGGWYADAACTTPWDFDDGVMPQANLTLYALWHTAAADIAGTVEGDAVTFTGYTGSLTAFAVPATIGGKPVTKIAAFAFEGCDLYKLTIPASVTEIEPGAFFGCRNLAIIEVAAESQHFAVSDGVLLSADGTRLLRYPPVTAGSSYTLPATVTAIDSYAFYGASQLRSLTLPAGLENVGHGAFAYCTGLTRLTFPSGINALGAGLFEGCDRAIQLFGPVEDCPIKTYAEAFYHDYNLYPVQYYNGAEMYYQLYVRAGDTVPEMQTPADERRVFVGWCVDSALTTPFDRANTPMPAGPLPLYIQWGYAFTYTGTNALTVTGYTGTDNFIAIPEDMEGKPVTAIAANALVSTAAKLLYEITVPASVTNIAAGAIRGISSADQTVVIGDVGSAAQTYVTDYGTAYHVAWQARQYSVTYDTRGGKSMAPRTVTPGAAVPQPVPVRDNYTFGGWYADAALITAWTGSMPAEDITLYAKWTVVDAAIPDPPFTYEAEGGEVTLTGYTGGSNFVTLPESINGEPVTAVAPYFLQGDTRVQKLTLPACVTGIGAYAFADSALQKVTLLGPGQINIGAGAFSGCVYLNSVEINRGMTEFAPYLFADCTALLALTLPADLTSIGNGALQGCAYLQELTLPAGVSQIGSSAFAECGALRTVRFQGDLPAGLSGGAFRYTHRDLTLLYTDGAAGWTSPTLTVTEPDESTTVFHTAAVGGSGAYIQSLTPNRRNSVVDNELIWTAAVAGTGPWTYQYTLCHDGEEIERTAYLSAASYAYTPETAGVYRLEVTARNGAGVTTAPRASEVMVTRRVIPIESLTMSAASAMLNVEETKQLSVTVTPENATDPALSWSSSNPNVATVDDTGLVTAIGLGSASICAAAADGKTARCQVIVTIELKPAIAVLMPAGDLYVGGSKRLTVRYDYFDTNPTGVTWRSSDTDVATVDANGNLRGIAPGTATVTATAKGGSGVEGTLQVTVLPVLMTGLSITAPDVLGVGGSMVLTAAVTPNNATDKSVTWSLVSGGEYASLNAETAALTGLAPGTVTVRATANDGSGVYAEKTIEVVAWSIVVTGAGTELVSGKTMQLRAAYVPPEMTAGAFIWSLRPEDAAYASVSQNGLVTAKAVTARQPVQVTVRSALSGPLPGTYDLDILPKASEVALYQEGVTEPVGRTGQSVQTLAVDMQSTPTIQFTAAIAPADAGQQVTWKSSSPAIATVSAEGLVTLLKPGAATITATAGDGSGKAASVKLQSYYITQASKLTAASAAEPIPAIGLQTGQSTQMQVFGTDMTAPMDAARFTYSIPPAQADVASVNAGGRITAGSKAGTATVTAALIGDPLGRKATLPVKVIPLQTDSVLLLPTAPAPAVVVGRDADGAVTTVPGDIVSYDVDLDRADMPAAGYTFTIASRAVLTGGTTVNNPPLTFASTDAGVAAVRANADGTATVTLKPTARGACTITGVSKDLAKREGSLSIFLRDYAPRLGADKLALNPRQAGGTEIALLPGYGNVITAVRIYEYDAARRGYSDAESTRLRAAYAGDTLTVEAIGSIGNGSIKTQLAVDCADSRTYLLPLTVTVKNAEPAITIKQQGKFNLFYSDSTATLNVAAKNAKITDIAFDTSTFAAAYNGDGATATVGYASPPVYDAAGKPVVRGTVLVSVEGYAQPIPKAFTLATAMVKPSLALSPAASIINTAIGQRTATLTVYDKLNKRTLDLDAGSVTYTAPFATVTADDAADTLTLTLTGTAGGTAVIAIQNSNWTQAVTLNHKVTVQTALPTAKLGAGTLQLSSVYTQMTAQTPLTLNQANLSLSTVNVASTAAPGTAARAEADKLEIAYHAGSGMMEAGVKPGQSPKAGTYAFTLTPVLSNGTPLRALNLRVSVKATQPRASLATPTLKLNSVLAGKETAASAFKLNLAGYTLTRATVVRAANNARNDGDILFGFDAATATVTAALATPLPKGTYNYTLTPYAKPAGLAQEAALAPVTLRVQVYDNAALGATVAAEGKLDLALTESSISFAITKLTNLTGTVNGVTLSGADAANFTAALAPERNAKGQQRVTLRLKDGASYSAAYRIQFHFTLAGMDGVVAPTALVNVKAVQSALKLSAVPAAGAVYPTQGKTAVVRYTLMLTSPNGAKIKDVTLNSGTAAALKRALGANALRCTLNADGRSATVELRLQDVSKLKAGASYALLLDVQPECAAVGAKPTTVRLTVRAYK